MNKQTGTVIQGSAALLCIGILLISCSAEQSGKTGHPDAAITDNASYFTTMSDTSDTEKVTRTDEEWRELLTSAQYRILRRGGTEMPFINEYNSHDEEGVYHCAGCGNPLFHSDTKYNSRSGWPSFWAPIREGAVAEKEDNSLMMTRTEILCNRCDSHLGHVFDDGPEPTGLRYCMNSAAMKFVAAE